MLSRGANPSKYPEIPAVIAITHFFLLAFLFVPSRGAAWKGLRLDTQAFNVEMTFGSPERTCSPISHS
jgi:hypothetical protein